MVKAEATPASEFFFTDQILGDPYPIYQRFLESDQLIHRVNYAGGAWIVFRHSVCSSLIRDPRLSSKRVGAFTRAIPEERHSEFDELWRVLRSWLLFIDAPEHSRLRKLMNRGFSPAVAEELRPKIEEVVDRMLAPMKHASEVDILREVAYPLPVRVIAEMFGAPETMHEHFIRWSDAVTTFLGSPNKTPEQTQLAQDAILALMEFFRQAVGERRQKKGSDLISLLLDIEADGEVLTEEELYAQCVMLLGAGHETTRNLIGNGMYTLLRHPEQTAALRANPELIRTTVEELLRYESPIRFVARLAKEDMEVCGVRILQGEPVVFMLAAANRDPRQFRDPDRLDIKRLNNPHLAFGAGEHFCIGNQLARMEGQIAILSMVQQFHRMRLADQHPEWVPNYGFRGLKRLPVIM